MADLALVYRSCERGPSGLFRRRAHDIGQGRGCDEPGQPSTDVGRRMHFQMYLRRSMSPTAKANSTAQHPPAEHIILGIDPGTTIMGYGVIKVIGKKVELVEMGALHLSKYKDHAVKLKRIFDRCAALIETHAPDHLAVEAPFFGKNVQSMLKLGRAQGVALAAALSRDIPVSEYAPRKVKQSITGSGSASKEQVAAMVARTLAIPMEKMPKELDASDGLAVALCHHFQLASPRMQAGYSGWKAFVQDQSDRVIG